MLEANSDSKILFSEWLISIWNKIAKILDVEMKELLKLKKLKRHSAYDYKR